VVRRKPSERAGDATPPSASFVRSLSRGLKILEAFSTSAPVLTHIEIANRTGLPKPTVTRLTQTLLGLGYLERAPDGAGFFLAPRLASLGSAALNGSGVAKAARPYMQELADRFGAEVGLAAREGSSVVYLENCRTENEIQLHIVPGTRLPLDIIAIGHAYVAALGEDQQRLLLQSVKLRHGQRGREIIDGLNNSLHHIARHGFCIAEGWAVDLRSVAVPLVLPGASDPYALDCSGPAELFPKRRMQTEVGPMLVGLARRIVSLYERR
jgi:DNA-binding IclR family transcriptional regulator